MSLYRTKSWYWKWTNVSIPSDRVSSWRYTATNYTGRWSWQTKSEMMDLSRCTTTPPSWCGFRLDCLVHLVCFIEEDGTLSPAKWRLELIHPKNICLPSSSPRQYTAYVIVSIGLLKQAESYQSLKVGTFPTQSVTVLNTRFYQEYWGELHKPHLRSVAYKFWLWLLIWECFGLQRLPVTRSQIYRPCGTIDFESVKWEPLSSTKLTVDPRNALDHLKQRLINLNLDAAGITLPLEADYHSCN